MDYYFHEFFVTNKEEEKIKKLTRIFLFVAVLDIFGVDAEDERPRPRVAKPPVNKNVNKQLMANLKIYSDLFF